VDSSVSATPREQRTAPFAALGARHNDQPCRRRSAHSSATPSPPTNTRPAGLVGDGITGIPGRVAVMLGVNVMVRVAVTVGVSDAVLVSDGVTVTVAVSVDVTGAAVSVAVLVSVVVGDRLGDTVGVIVGVSDGVSV